MIRYERITFKSLPTKRKKFKSRNLTTNDTTKTLSGKFLSMIILKHLRPKSIPLKSSTPSPKENLLLQWTKIIIHDPRHQNLLPLPNLHPSNISPLPIHFFLNPSRLPRRSPNIRMLRSHQHNLLSPLFPPLPQIL